MTGRSYLRVVVLFHGIVILAERESGCGNEKDMRTAPGSIASHPGFGNTLAPSAFCEWIITPPRDKYVSVKITDMTNMTCYTHLFVYTETVEGKFPGWNLCDSVKHHQDYPTDEVPYHLASRRGKWLRIWYKGNTYEERTAGFKLQYDYREPGCSGHETLRGSEGYIVSHPGVGLWALEAGSVCSWTITAPTGRFVAFTDSYIRLHCHNDWQTLSIYDTDTANDTNLIARVSCTDRLPPMASTGRSLHLVYDDQWASNSLGFNITYQFYNKSQSGCGGNYELSEPSGTIFSHTEFNVTSYNPWSRCQWKLVAPQNGTLVVRFLSFDVPSTYEDKECSLDMLVVQNGEHSSSGSGHLFCNGQSAPPKLLLSTSGALKLKFFSERLNYKLAQGRGFAISYARWCPNIPTVKHTTHYSKDENKDGESIVTHGETVHYSCAAGYVAAEGDTLRTCLAAGSLNGSDLICRPARCHHIEHPENSVVHYTDANKDGVNIVSHGETVLYVCLEGFQATDGDNERKCKSDGHLSGKPIKCIAIRCPAYQPSANSVVIPMDRNRDGLNIITYKENVMLSCIHGYMEYQGSTLRYCQADGTYSGSDLQCLPRECKLPNITNSIMENDDINSDGLHDVTYGETVTFKCQKGHRQTAGDAVRFCNADGFLDGVDMQCNIIRCSLPPSIANSFYVLMDINMDGDEVMTYGETAVYHCSEGYTRRGGDVSKTCDENGLLTGQDITCQEIRCTLSKFSEGLILDDDVHDDIRLNNCVTYKCSHEYVRVNGSGTSCCMQDGTFSDTSLVCEKKVCRTLPVIKNAVITSDYNAGLLGSFINITCHEDYMMNFRLPYVLHSCDVTGTWHGDEVTCQSRFEGQKEINKVKRDLIVTASVAGVILVTVLIICCFVASSYQCRTHETPLPARTPASVMLPNTEFSFFSPGFIKDVSVSRQPVFCSSSSGISSEAPSVAWYSNNWSRGLREEEEMSVAMTANQNDISKINVRSYNSYPSDWY